MVSGADVEKALAILDEGRASHVKWRDHLRWHEQVTPTPCPQCEGTKTVEAIRAGRWSSSHEQTWVEHYDLLIRVTRDLANASGLL